MYISFTNRGGRQFEFGGGIENHYKKAVCKMEQD